MQLLNSKILFNDKNTRYSSKKAQDTQYLVLFVCCSFFVHQRWRRKRDSNPRGVSPKRFSRPPRYDRFDIPPQILIKYNKLIFNCQAFDYYILLYFILYNVIYVIELTNQYNSSIIYVLYFRRIKNGIFQKSKLA